jgi:hypothetical protein
LRERSFELKRESLGVFSSSMFVAFLAREVWGSFYSPQENLAFGVSEIQTCPGQEPDMFSNRL